MQYLLPYNHIVLYKSYNEGCIIDFKKNKIIFSDNQLIELLINKDIKLEQINNESSFVITQKQFESLIKNNMFFITDLKSNFQIRQNERFNYSLIENITINFDIIKNDIFNLLHDVCYNFNVKALKINLSIYSPEIILKCLNVISGLPLESVECILSFDEISNNKDFLLKMKNECVTLTSVNYLNTIQLDEIENFNNLTIRKYSNNFPKILISQKLYIESVQKNNYYNQKLYIGPSGEIKNAPESDEIFGNIIKVKNTEDLKKIISIPEFQKYWEVHKDIQDVCKDCAFRYICVDNKVPYQRSENEWYHKIECNYNPYISKWKGEEGYKTLAECGVISNENGFSIDHDKIAEINKVLWGE